MNKHTLSSSRCTKSVLLLLLCFFNSQLFTQHNNIVLYETSGDGGNIEARNDAIVELAGFPGDDIGCMLITNTEWAIVIPAGTKIPADGVFLIACSDGNNGGTGAYTGAPTGLSCDVCDFPGLVPDFDVCDPRNANYVAISVNPNYGFTLDNTICRDNADGDQVMLFRPDGTPHDAVYWGAPTTTNANGGTMTLGGSAGSCGSPNDHVSVQIGIPYTLGDNDDNGIINDYTGTHIGFRGDGGNSTGVKYLVSGNDDYGNPVIAGTQLTIPPGDCNANQILYTVPSLADPIWVNVGLSLPSCNSTHIRINDTSPEGNSRQEIKSSTTSSHMDDPDLNLDWVDYLPIDLVPSSIDPNAAAMQWQVTNHPTPGKPNAADTWDFFIDIDNNGFDTNEEIKDKNITSIVLCEPTALDFQLQVFNYQHVEPTMRSANKAGTFVRDENGTDQTWDLIQVGSNITATQGTMVSAEDGITTLQYTTNLLPVGKHEFELVWDDYTDCCGSSANNTVVNSSNPHECYETLTVEIEVVEPLIVSNNMISCPEDFLPGVVNIGSLITGGYQVLYELFLDDTAMNNIPASSNGTGIFNLPTHIAMNDIRIRVTSQEPCPTTEIIRVNLNCVNPPVCPENFDIITGSTANDIVLCPEEEVQLCFSGEMLPIGGQVTWTIDGIEEEVGALPIPSPICPTVIGAYVNACNEGQGEDENEYIVIRNGNTAINAEDLSVVYTTPTRDLTENIIPTTDANVQAIVASFNADCSTMNPFILVSTGDQIPANATILLMNGESLPDFDFDFSDPDICNSTIYLIFGDGGWRSGGTFVNNPADDRFFTASIKNNPACPGNTVAYNRNISNFDDRDGQAISWYCNNDMIEANGIFEGSCSSDPAAGHVSLLVGGQSIDCLPPTNGFFSGSLGCITYVLPLDACTASPLVFRANLTPFPDDCPLNADDEDNTDAGTISVYLTCPTADLVPLTTNQCVGDGQIEIMVNLTGLTTGNYCLTYLNEMGNSETISVPATSNGITTGVITIPDSSTNGEVDIQLLHVFANTDDDCTSTILGECMGTIDFDVATIQISSPPTVELIASTDLEDCDPHNDPIGQGSITFEFTGDAPFEFEYSLNDGDPIAAAVNTSTFVLPVSAAGTYQVLSVTNDTGCTGTIGNQTIQKVLPPEPLEIIGLSPMVFNNCTDNASQNNVEVNLATEVNFQIDVDGDNVANIEGNYEEINNNGGSGMLTWYVTQALLLNDINRQELAIEEDKLILSPPASQDYFFIYTHLDGCEVEGKITINISQTPDITANASITNTCPNTMVDLTDINLTGFMDNNEATNETEGIVSYHTIPNPVDANSSLVSTPTSVPADNTYYIRKEVNGCADIVPIVIELTSCNNCPIIGDILLSEASICSDGLFDLTITTLSNFAQADNNLADFGLQIMTYPLNITPDDPYSDTNVIELAHIPFADLQDSLSFTLPQVSSALPAGDYLIYVLLRPPPTTSTCRPFQVANLNIRLHPEEINLPSMACNNQVNVSLNRDCQLGLSLDFFLENPILNEHLTYAVVLDNSPDTLFFGNGNMPLEGSSFFENIPLGLTGYQVLVYLDYLDCEGNVIKIQDKCWGNILIEDKLAPVCAPQGDQELFIPFDSNRNGIIDNNEYYVSDPSGVDDLMDEYVLCTLIEFHGVEPYFDILESGDSAPDDFFDVFSGDFADCSGIKSIYYNDEVFDICNLSELAGFPVNTERFNSTAFNITKVYQRTWNAIDFNGMTTTQGCSQFVYALQPKVILLDPVIEISCTENLEHLDYLGTPYFTVDNNPITGIINGGQGSGTFFIPAVETFQLKSSTLDCNYATSFHSSSALSTCGNNFKQFRHWTVIDECNGTRLYDQFTQTVKIIDDNLPSIHLAGTATALPRIDTPNEIMLGVDTIFNTQIFECFATGQLPNFEVIDNCNIAQIENIRVERINVDFHLDAIVEDYNIEGNLEELNLPEGIYVATYTFVDACGNRNTYSLKFAVVDKRIPTAICNDELHVSLLIDRVTGMQQARVYAEDFDDTSFDNCSELTYEVRSIGNESLVDDGWSAYVEFTCADVGGVQVELRVTDAEGYSNSCWTTVQLYSSDIFYTCDEALCHIGGQIRTASGIEVENVQLSMMIENDTIRTVSTDVLGKYRAVNLYAHHDYQILPKMNIDPLNGVSTMDMLQIRKHVLGQQYLDSPYQMIAADINHSGSVTTADLVALRRVILQLDSTFMDNTSWCFIPAEYEFPNPSNPWATEIPMSATINDVPSGNVTVDFIAIKIGDVNGSVIPNAPIQTNEANFLQQANDSVIDRIAADEIQLIQNQPNPFTNQTSIHFYLPAEEQIKLSIFTLTGGRIILWNERLTAGYHTYQLSATALSTHGVYCYALETETTQIVKKMVRLK